MNLSVHQFVFSRHFYTRWLTGYLNLWPLWSAVKLCPTELYPSSLRGPVEYLFMGHEIPGHLNQPQQLMEYRLTLIATPYSMSLDLKWVTWNINTFNKPYVITTSNFYIYFLNLRWTFWHSISRKLRKRILRDTVKKGFLLGVNTALPNLTGLPITHPLFQSVNMFILMWHNIWKGCSWQTVYTIFQIYVQNLDKIKNHFSTN